MRIFDPGVHALTPVGRELDGNRKREPDRDCYEQSEEHAVGVPRRSSGKHRFGDRFDLLDISRLGDNRSCPSRG
jgi:hypothetical protein